ncbi:hypothetical protein CgunFtcFv8_010628 [Champsocephalus gunnari]|uniref:Uncharacterized protein n=1 Tax=Champsocephalus gunnari TaxID=52237 RepID=A0AAN8DUB4_CHAGU|nr:hypothetical protein CgunFtcFv8_010628 [Champsocephalus gunnari]
MNVKMVSRQINPGTWSEAQPCVQAALSLGVTLHCSSMCPLHDLWTEGRCSSGLTGKGRCYTVSNRLHIRQDKPGHILSLCSSPVRIQKQSPMRKERGRKHVSKVDKRQRQFTDLKKEEDDLLHN